MSDLIKREDAIRIMACEMYAEAQAQGYEVDSLEDFMTEAKAWMNDAPSADRPQGEWIDCKEPPSTDKNVFIAYGTDDMKSVCIGHYRHDMKLWYEDKNFFAKPIYDAMYWCEIPQFPTWMEGADDE